MAYREERNRKRELTTLIASFAIVLDRSVEDALKVLRSFKYLLESKPEGLWQLGVFMTESLTIINLNFLSMDG